jgi:hypothetical protein
MSDAIVEVAGKIQAFGDARVWRQYPNAKDNLKSSAL